MLDYEICKCRDKRLNIQKVIVFFCLILKILMEKYIACFRERLDELRE